MVAQSPHNKVSKHREFGWVGFFFHNRTVSVVLKELSIYHTDGFFLTN